MTPSQSIKVRMKKLGLSYRDLGKKSGINASTIWRIAHGKENISFEIVRAVLKSLNLKLQIVEGTQEKE